MRTPTPRVSVDHTPSGVSASVRWRRVCVGGVWEALYTAATWGLPSNTGPALGRGPSLDLRLKDADLGGPSAAPAGVSGWPAPASPAWGTRERRQPGELPHAPCLAPGSPAGLPFPSASPRLPRRCTGGTQGVCLCRAGTTGKSTPTSPNLSFKQQVTPGTQPPQLPWPAMGEGSPEPLPAGGLHPAPRFLHPGARLCVGSTPPTGEGSPLRTEPLPRAGPGVL